MEYRWKMERGLGLMVCHQHVSHYWLVCRAIKKKLIQVDTNKEIAQYSRQLIKEGLFAQEKRAVLRFQPCSLDIDLIILSFLIFAKKRRDRGGDGTKLTPHDEDPQGDGGFSGAEAGDA